MTKIEQYILERLDNLERAFLQSQNNNIKVTENADKAPVVEIKVNDLDDAVEQNSTDISDTMEGLTETFEVTSTNTDDISICMDAITEIYEQIGGWQYG